MADKFGNIICIDFETGGLDKKNNNHAQIVAATQIGLYSFRADDFKHIGEFKTYIAPYGGLEYQQEALDFTGVTMAQINAGMPVKEVVDNLINEFTKATTGNKRFYKPVLLGHNIQFDIQFLQYIFKFCNKDLSQYLAGTQDAFGNFYPAFYDTLWMARSRWLGEGMEKFKLDMCCSKAGIELIDAHEAMADVRATVELYQYFVNSMRNGEAGELQEAGEETGKARFRKSFQF